MASGVGESSSTGGRRSRTLTMEEAFPDNTGFTENKYEVFKSNKESSSKRMRQTSSAAALERKVKRLRTALPPLSDSEVEADETAQHNELQTLRKELEKAREEADTYREQRGFVINVGERLSTEWRTAMDSYNVVVTEFPKSDPNRPSHKARLPLEAPKTTANQGNFREDLKEEEIAGRKAKNPTPKKDSGGKSAAAKVEKAKAEKAKKEELDKKGKGKANAVDGGDDSDSSS